MRLDVFSIRGLVLEGECIGPVVDNVRGIEFRMAFGTSLNEMSKRTVGDIFVDEEEQWKKDTQCIAPFLLLVFGPTGEYVGSGTHAKEYDGTIETYDSFRGARSELQKQADALIPSLLTSLTLTFSKGRSPVRFLPCDSVVFGKSNDGREIVDFQLKFSGEGFVASKISNHFLMQNAILSIEKSRFFDNDISKLYYLAINEKDNLKRFLYIFFFIERIVNVTCESIRLHDVRIESAPRYENVKEYVNKILTKSLKSERNILDRFTWCVMHKWNHLTDSDIKQFEYVKNVRNQIAHGELSAPDGSAVAAIEALVQRIYEND